MRVEKVIEELKLKRKVEEVLNSKDVQELLYKLVNCKRIILKKGGFSKEAESIVKELTQVLRKRIGINDIYITSEILVYSSYINLKVYSSVENEEIVFQWTLITINNETGDRIINEFNYYKRYTDEYIRKMLDRVLEIKKEADTLDNYFKMILKELI